MKAPAGTNTRPTSDRVREAIASALAARDAIAGARVLDLYAGSGALGLEMISRGAASAVFVERDGRTARLIRENAKELGVEALVEVLSEDITRARGRDAAVQRGPFTLLLADPPYRDVHAAVAAITALSERGALAPDACLLLEHGAKGVPDLPAPFEVLATYRYGDTGVILFEVASQAARPADASPPESDGGEEP